MTRTFSIGLKGTLTVDDDVAVEIDALLARGWRLSIGKGYPHLEIKVHHLVLPRVDTRHIDHVNGDKLDARRDNLRRANRSQNRINSGLDRHNTSGYKGVSWAANCEKWRVRLKVDGRDINLGLFERKKDAALAYDQAVRDHFGNFGRYNFPREGEQGV